jgi:predicted  nucleic acid-binding Zn-ribbon protein
MALLEQIEKMKQAGQSDSQIVTTLKEQGYSLTQINETLSQSRIKSAVYGSIPQAGDELQPSIMQNNTPSEQAPQQQQVNYQQESPGVYPDQQYQDPNATQGYAQDTYYSQALDVETVRDITRQEIDEAVKKIKQDLEALNKMKSDISFEVQNLDNRITKIEAIIQELQSAIIRKMGEYGESIQGISQELQATQNSFSKIINPLLDKTRESEESGEEQSKVPSENQEPQKPERTQNKKQKDNKKSDISQLQRSDSASFEDYFR